MMCVNLNALTERWRRSRVCLPTRPEVAFHLVLPTRLEVAFDPGRKPIAAEAHYLLGHRGSAARLAAMKIYRVFPQRLHHRVPHWVEGGALFHIRIALDRENEQRP